MLATWSAEGTCASRPSNSLHTETTDTTTSRHTIVRKSTYRIELESEQLLKVFDDCFQNDRPGDKVMVAHSSQGGGANALLTSLEPARGSQTHLRRERGRGRGRVTGDDPVPVDLDDRMHDGRRSVLAEFAGVS